MAAWLSGSVLSWST